MFFLVGFSNYKTSRTPDTEALVYTMVQAIEEAKVVRFKIKSWERFSSEIKYSENDLMLQSSPTKIYMKQWSPDKGVEVLYADGARDNMALVKPAGFPYVNVKLDPMGWRMRENQHHTIFESGFDYTASLIKAALAFHGDKMEEFTSVTYGVQVNDRLADILTIDNSAFAWESVTIQQDISVYHFAKQRQISAHMLSEKNEDVKITGTLQQGTTIQVPNAYAPKVTLAVDRENHLPLQVEISDEEGLFEKYQFWYIEVNPQVSELHFTKQHPGAGF